MTVEWNYDGKNLPANTLVLTTSFSIGYHAVNRGNVQKGVRIYVVGMLKTCLDYALWLGTGGAINA
jgi:hypothetical protein